MVNKFFKPWSHNFIITTHTGPLPSGFFTIRILSIVWAA